MNLLILIQKLNQRRSRQTSGERQMYPLEVGLMSDEEEVGNEYITQPLPWVHPQLKAHILQVSSSRLDFHDQQVAFSYF